jgi:hypothetical protein
VAGAGRIMMANESNKVQISGIKVPKGYTLTGVYRTPLIGDRYLSRGGKMAYADKKMYSQFLILSKIQSPTVNIVIPRELAVRAHAENMAVTRNGNEFEDDGFEWALAIEKALK